MSPLTAPPPPHPHTTPTPGQAYRAYQEALIYDPANKVAASRSDALKLKLGECSAPHQLVFFCMFMHSGFSAHVRVQTSFPAHVSVHSCHSFLSMSLQPASQPPAPAAASAPPGLSTPLSHPLPRGCLPLQTAWRSSEAPGWACSTTRVQLSLGLGGCAELGACRATLLNNTLAAGQWTGAGWRLLHSEWGLHGCGCRCGRVSSCGGWAISWLARVLAPQSCTPAVQEPQRLRQWHGPFSSERLEQMSACRTNLHVLHMAGPRRRPVHAVAPGPFLAY